MDDLRISYDYTVISGIKCIEDGGEARVFGLRVRDHEHGLTTELPDICTDGEKLCSLAADLQTGQLPLIHLLDVLEDFLE